MSVFGRAYGQRIRGEVRMHGQAIDVSTIRKAIDHGIAYVTEDRKSLGLLLEDEAAACLCRIGERTGGGETACTGARRG